MAHYRCAAGHEVKLAPGVTYTAMLVDDGTTPATGYNYCQHCLCAWAVRQFPLIEEKSDGIGS